MPVQFIFTMRDLRRVHPPDKEVLRGINISMFPGAKIGVLGANGSGKSSLLRIMAGEDDGYTGEARLTSGFSVGFLSQEPRLDPAKDVMGNVAEGVGEAAALLDRYNEVCEAMGDADADFDKLLAEQADLNDRIEAAGAWELDRTLEVAMDALNIPPGDAPVTNLSGGERRRVALCRLLLQKPDLLLLDEPTNHLDAESVAWLERTLQEYGGTVVAVDHRRKGYGERLLIDDLSFSLPRGGIVGVIGPNGAGKTTLFRMILGQEAPDGGGVRVGPTVSFAYVDQSRETIDPEKTVYQEITGGLDTVVVSGREMHGRAYVGSFGFKGSDQQKKAGVLSGGERNRLQLAKVLLAGGNVLLLDEPTNDLDVDTLRALEEGLLAFPGCAVVISHDRWFLDRIATHVLAFEGESEVRWLEGNFSDYAADRHRRLGAEADQPHRIRYKPAVRD